MSETDATAESSAGNPDRSGLGKRVATVSSAGFGLVRGFLTTGRARRVGHLPRRRTALSLVLVVLALISGPAIALNAVAIDPGDTEPAMTVDGYGVAYEEEVENQLLSVVPIDAFGSNDTVTASGVIVWSTERPLWTDAVSADRLAYSGTASIELGGIGWRETVSVERTGWSVVGNDSTYQVWLESPSTDRTLAYESDPHRSSVEIDGTTIGVGSNGGTFVVRAEDDRIGTTSRAIPDPGEAILIGDLRIVREDDRLVAERNGTRAVIATAETYR